VTSDSYLKKPSCIVCPEDLPPYARYESKPEAEPGLEFYAILVDPNYDIDSQVQYKLRSQ